jgi:hypothetical protein
MGTPTFDKNDVVDVKKGAVTCHHVWIRKAEGDRYEGTYRTKARKGNPTTHGRVSFTGDQVIAWYEKILARYGE